MSGAIQHRMVWVVVMQSLDAHFLNGSWLFTVLCSARITSLQFQRFMNKSEVQNWGAYGSGQTGLLGRVASPSWLSAGSYQHSWWWWGLGLNSGREETMVLSIKLLPRAKWESPINAISCHWLSSIQSHSASCAGVLMSRGPLLGPVRKSWKHYGNICSMFTRWSWSIGTQSNRNCKKQGGLAARIGFCVFWWYCWQRIGS